jgi:hypothetical protein
MLADQGGRCAICEKPHKPLPTDRFQYLHVDHCHDTKKVRGLLCGNCNVGIGNLKHDIEILKKAMSYLFLYG